MLDKINVIDLGSSSVRFMQVQNGEVLKKSNVVCRLAENKQEGFLNKESMLRTAKVVQAFVNEAKVFGGDVFIFATASLRNSLNGQAFAEYLKDLTGVDVEIISGEEEAEIGLLGALKGRDGAVIDIGGASSEIIVAKNGLIVYEKSLPLGGVILKEQSNSNLENAKKIAREAMSFYGRVPSSCFFGIGGTATCVAAVVLGLKEYDRIKVDGYKLTKEKLLFAEKYLLGKTAKEVAKETCVNLKRAEILPYGVQILKEVFNLLDIDYIIVSESDNLEGFLLKKGGMRYGKG